MQLTSPGPGAVAVIRVQSSLDAAEAVLRPFVRNVGWSASTAECDRILYGSWNGEDVVLVRLAADAWEIHCHGGYAAVSSILNDLRNAGLETVRMPASGVMVSSCFQESEVADRDMVDKVLQRALIDCRTRLAADRILRQTDGRLTVLRSQLRSRNPAIRGLAESIVHRWKFYAEHLTQPFRIAFLGAPNVGKSSLLNALTGRQRSIVSAIPGTTRDVVEAEIVVDGWILRLSDTAGLRATADSALELEGIERARSLSRHIDLLCCVTDREDGCCDSELSHVANSFPGPVLLVRNKSDLRQESSAESFPEQRSGSQVFHAEEFALLPVRCDQIVDVSALAGHGIHELASQMLRLLIPQEPEPDTAIAIGGCVNDLL